MGVGYADRRTDRHPTRCEAFGKWLRFNFNYLSCDSDDNNGDKRQTPCAVCSVGSCMAVPLQGIARSIPYNKLTNNESCSRVCWLTNCFYYQKPIFIFYCILLSAPISPLRLYIELLICLLTDCNQICRNHLPAYYYCSYKKKTMLALK